MVASGSSDGGELQRTTTKRNDNRDGVGDVIQATEAGSRALGREQVVFIVLPSVARNIQTVRAHEVFAIRPRAWFGRLDYIVDTIAAVVPLRRHHCSRCCSLPLLQSLLLAAVTAAACRRSLLPLAAVAVTAAPLAFS
ncbi:hypothetical protein GW17_00038079 [Ensete ventricosum]|nr:hypothetical protein GW17_00038079 [Ensete ventricosum]